MTTGTFVPFGRISDLWTIRTWVERTSNTNDNALVRTKAPHAKKFTVVVPVQFWFTLTLPLRVSLANLPPTSLASVPETFPAVSISNLITAAAGAGPIGAGKRAIPVSVAPHFPAIVASEHVS